MIEKLYTIKEVAELIGVSKRTIFRYIHTNSTPQLKAFKVGKTWRISEMDLMEFIEYCTNFK